jgi:hypothetical protein
VKAGFACCGARTAVVAAAAVALTTVVPAASDASRHPDVRGDLFGRSGPDLVAVTVSHTATAIRFRVVFAQAPPLQVNVAEQWLDVLAIAIDVPPRGPGPTVAGWAGADYAITALARQKTAVLTKAPRWRAVGNATVATRGRAVTVTVPRRRLGNPARFDYVVAGGREGAVSDSAPDRGTFRYVVGR